MERYISEAVRQLLRSGNPLRDERGAVAVLFALLIAPLIFLVGAALDYSGAANLKTHLQKATDGTNLRLCQVPNNPSKAELTEAAT